MYICAHHELVRGAAVLSVTSGDFYHVFQLVIALRWRQLLGRFVIVRQFVELLFRLFEVLFVLKNFATKSCQFVVNLSRGQICKTKSIDFSGLKHVLLLLKYR